MYEFDECIYRLNFDLNPKHNEGAVDIPSPFMKA